MSLILTACYAFALLGVALTRWLRWHFLLRRFDIRVRVRDTLVLYFATLPMALTPAGMGEVLRCESLARRGSARRGLYSTFVLDRFADLAALAFLAGTPMFSSEFLVGLGVTSLITFVVAAQLPNGRNLGIFDFVLTLWIGSVLSVLSFSLILLPRMLVGPEAIEAGPILSRGLINFWAQGPLGSVPIWMIMSLTAVVWVTSFRRAKSVVLGDDGQAQSHFEELASEYNDEIPEHVRQMLLKKKINYTFKFLNEAGFRNPSQLKGLDFGCGHGWYAIELARLGVQMSGCDRSLGQIEMARKNAEAARASIDLSTLEGAELPYGDHAFDFVYSINVFHHITDSVARLKVFKEMVRILRPGGILVLHDVNVRNPIFRLYMSYVFPLLKRIDDGTEVWIDPRKLSSEFGQTWLERVEYFTFFPDFIPRPLLNLLLPLERRLEQTSAKVWSAHFCAGFKKEPTVK